MDFSVLFGTIFCIVFFYFLNTLKRPRRYPPGPQWLPIIGNSSQLKKLSQKYGGMHLATAHWAKEYNTNVLGLRLGNENVVVLFSAKTIRQALNCEHFDGRPDSFFIRLRTMGTRMGITCTEGQLWMEQRNFAVRHLRQVGYGKQAMEDQILMELEDLIVTLKKDGPEISFGSAIAPSVLNVLWTFTAGNRIPRDNPRLDKLLKLFARRSKVFDMAGGILGQMPWLRFIAPEKTGYNLLVNFNKELYGFFKETIKEHQISHTEGKTDDLIYAYITEINDRKGQNSSFTEDQLTMVILDIFIAGAQTTSNTLDFAFLMMLLRQDIQKKVQEEMSKVLKGKPPTLEHRQHLPYTVAVLMEIQRYFHIVPLNGPRRVTQDTEIDGFVIPENTTVFMSLHSIHKDPEYWQNPEEFIPERFLNNGQIVQSERLIPFGLGRRRCLGEALAKACMFIFFTGILQNFAITNPTGNENPSSKPNPGITLTPKPYIAHVSSR